MSERPPSREQSLDELDFVATVEHALIVEFLSIYCALGEGIPPDGHPLGSVEAAAEVAHRLALREMRHLHQVNRALGAAGRPVQVGRASSIEWSGSGIPLGPPTAAQLEQLVARERDIASAVDERYARLCAATALADLLSPCPDHVEPLKELTGHLQQLAPADFLRVTRREPGNEVERTLLDVSDQHYRLIVATVRASFAHEDQLGELLNRALTTMDVLEAINHLLVESGLLPAFTL